jgi:hypothetical protein
MNPGISRKGTMWALLMDGQQQGIGQNSDCCICTKVTGTESRFGRDWANLPIHLRVNMDAILAEWREVPDVPREMY